MANKMTYLDKPIDVKDSDGTILFSILGFGEAKKIDYLKKHDLFVKENNIYILDTFEHKTGMKIAAFNIRIQKAIQEAKDIAESCKQEKFEKYVPLQENPDIGIPKMTIYVNCPDTEISERASKVLTTIKTAAAQGVRFTIKVVGNENGAWAKALLSKDCTKPLLQQNQR